MKTGSKLGRTLAGLLLAGFVGTGLAGCESHPEAHGLQAHDIREMTDQLAPDLLQIPEIVNNPTRITVVVKGMTNGADVTSRDAGKNMDILVARLAGLLSTHATDRIQFVEERRTLDRMRAEEGGTAPNFEQDSRGGVPPDPTIHPQYFLYGKVLTMDEGKGTYYHITFTLTNAATGAFVWSKPYEVQTLDVR